MPVAPKDEPQQDTAATAAAPPPKAPPASAAALLGVAPADAPMQRTSSIFGSLQTPPAPPKSPSATGGRSHGTAKAAGRGRSGEAADWPYYSAELERKLAQEHHEGNPPLAFIDVRRTNTYTQFMGELRTRKKSWGFWVDQGVRVYVRMLPRHSDAPVPQELKPFDLRKSYGAWLHHPDQPLLERGTMDDIEVVDALWLLLVVIVQPESRRVRALVYKGVQQQQQQQQHWQQAREQQQVKHTCPRLSPPSVLCHSLLCMHVPLHPMTGAPSRPTPPAPPTCSCLSLPQGCGWSDHPVNSLVYQTMNMANGYLRGM